MLDLVLYHYNHHMAYPVVKIMEKGLESLLSNLKYYELNALRWPLHPVKRKKKRRRKRTVKNDNKMKMKYLFSYVRHNDGQTSKTAFLSSHFK